MEKKKIIDLCVVAACPIISLDNEAQTNKQVKIKDDFGNTVFMSEEQLKKLLTDTTNFYKT